MIGPSLEGEWSNGPAAALVSGWWTAQVSELGMVLPDGSIDVMWAPGHEPWLAGPDTEPRQATIGAGVVVGLRLRPGGAQALLGQGADQVVNQRVSLEAIWPRSSMEALTDWLRATAPIGGG